MAGRRDWGKSRKEREVPAFVKTTAGKQRRTPHGASRQRKRNSSSKNQAFLHKKLIMTKSRGKSDDKHNYIENSCLTREIGKAGISRVEFVVINSVQSVKSVA